MIYIMSDKKSQNTLETVVRFDFKVRALVIDKTLLRSDELRSSKNSFYSYAIKMLLKHSDNSIINARIKLDGSGDRTFRRSFELYLRKSLNLADKKIIGNLKFTDSKSNTLIQLADMIAGSIRRNYEDTKLDRALYKKIIQKHIENEWKFR